ncbi:hypothetical protein LY76DRAFT_464387, partial [Colletotrichum caudatum]
QCSAERPRCTGCTAKGLECQYNVNPSESRTSALNRKHAEIECHIGCLEAVLSAMRFLPETQAYEVLREIRSGISIQQTAHRLESRSLLRAIA